MAPECSRINACSMFQYFVTEKVKTIFISLYCKGRFSRCARKQMFDEGKRVPSKLLPNGKMLP